MEFLWLWDCPSEIVLNDQEDCHTWRLDAYGARYGSLGLLRNAKFSFGWRSIGQQTDLLGYDCLIQINVLFVIKKMRRSNTF